MDIEKLILIKTYVRRTAIKSDGEEAVELSLHKIDITISSCNESNKSDLVLQFPLCFFFMSKFL